MALRPAGRLRPSALQSLVLKNNKLGSLGASHVAVMLRQQTALRHVDLSHTDMGRAGLVLLTHAIGSSTTIESVVLDHNHFALRNDTGAQSAHTETSAAVLAQIRRRNLTNVNIAPAMAKNNSLVSLSMKGVSLGDAMTSELARVLSKITTLQTLCLSTNRIENEGANQIATCLLAAPGSSLNSLDLSLNHIGDEGGIALANAIATNASLGSLDLSDNVIGANAAEVLLRALLQNQTLVRCGLDGNKVPYQQFTRLKARAHTNFLSRDAILQERQLTELRKLCIDEARMDQVEADLVAAKNESERLLALRKSEEADLIKLRRKPNPELVALQAEFARVQEVRRNGSSLANLTNSVTGTKTLSRDIRRVVSTYMEELLNALCARSNCTAMKQDVQAFITAVDKVGEEIAKVKERKRIRAIRALRAKYAVAKTSDEQIDLMLELKQHDADEVYPVLPPVAPSTSGGGGAPAGEDDDDDDVLADMSNADIEAAARAQLDVKTLQMTTIDDYLDFAGNEEDRYHIRSPSPNNYGAAADAAAAAAGGSGGNGPRLSDYGMRSISRQGLRRSTSRNSAFPSASSAAGDDQEGTDFDLDSVDLKSMGIDDPDLMK